DWGVVGCIGGLLTASWIDRTPVRRGTDVPRLGHEQPFLVVDGFEAARIQTREIAAENNISPNDLAENLQLPVPRRATGPNRSG
ncbi:MAG: hypothetical protein MI919_12725, partial [Holophagales bacterium]|nr:hypothetical protein [Holophagales bacterium]